MKKFWNDFRSFISRGNVIDLAVAVVVGGAFGKIVTSLVNDIIMPLISLAVGGADVSEWKWVIKPAVYDQGVLVTAETALKYGTFIQSIIDFLIISFFIFLAIKILTASRKRIDEFAEKIIVKTKKKNGKTKIEDIQIEKTKIEQPKKEETSLTILQDIRDLLERQNSNKKTETSKKNKKF